MLKRPLTILLAVLIPVLANAQQNRQVSKDIESIDLADFTRTDLFVGNTGSTERGASLIEGFASKATFTSLNSDALELLYIQRPEAVTFQIPFEDGWLELKLVQHNPLADDFILTTPDHPEGIPYSPPVFYKGIIGGGSNSLAGITITENEVIGVISSTETGNINLGRFKGEGATRDEYILVSERDLLVENPGGCATPDLNRYEEIPDHQTTDNSRTVNVPEVYVESDYQLYLNKGSVSATADYLTGIFNNSSIIFANDGIDILLSEIFVWTSNDGYSAASSYSALSDFQSFRTSFNGDIAHLAALDPGGLGGVAATINGLCNSNKYCYSDIDASYAAFPTYSWTIMVFTHEMGHLFGSYHTHWCGWPGGAIDNCYYIEGGCSPGDTPVDGGTIMSYCHLTAYGINFSNGFGPFPTDAMIDAIEAAPCLDGGGAGSEYCESYGSISDYEWIDQFRTKGIFRVSGDDGGYYDGTALSANLKQGVTKPMRVSAEMDGGPFDEYWKVWIDFNGDLDFDDPGEEVFSINSTSTGNITFPVNVPIDAVTGTTRIRVSMKHGSAPGPCEVFNYGEVEDYSLNILPALPASELVAGTTFNIYPNPATDQFLVSWPEAMGEDLWVSVYDLSGKLMKSEQFLEFDGSAAVPIQGLPGGIYIVRLEGPAGYTLTQQLVVE